MLSPEGSTPLVSNISVNNGVMGFSSYEALNKGNTISCSDTTLGAETMYYQERDFIGYQHIQQLTPCFERFNKLVASFIISVCRHVTMNKYDYGNKFNRDRMRQTCISLPILDNNQIDFAFMESFIQELEAERIQELEAERIQELEAYLKVSGLDNYELTEDEMTTLQIFDNRNSQWGTYKVGNLFNKIETKKLCYKAKELPKQPMGEYILPCLTSSFLNQGLNYYVPKAGATVLSNVISMPSNSDIYRAYYQPRDFTVLSDSYAFKWKSTEKELTPSQYLFMVMCINKVTDLPIYSYKNKVGGWNVVKEKDIRLPEKDGKIDFTFMESFITAIKKIVIKDIVKYAEEKSEATRIVVNRSN